jgi:Phosphotransferase enzyme family
MKPNVVARVERVLGTRSESWKRVESRGWTRNEHWTLVLADGTRAFAKEAAIPPSPEWLRQEARVYGSVSGPFMPAFLGFEDGECPLLVLEDVSPGAYLPPPWRVGDVEVVLDALAEVAALPADGLPEFPCWRAWERVAEDPAPFLSLDLVSSVWLERALPDLLAAQAAAPIAGDAFIHSDVRSDNLLLRDDRVVLVDWNHARRGNAALDVALWAASLALEGGPRPELLARESPGIDAFAAMVAGFFAERAGLSPPEGAPLVRRFQLDQLRIALPWACSVLGIEPPDR